MMKLLSYAHTNAELRRKYITTGAQTKLRRIQSSNDDLDAVAGEGEIAQPNAYPANLRLGDAMRFMAFPTLIYQTRYPRTRRIRSAWLLKRCGELFLVVSAMLLITTLLSISNFTGTDRTLVAVGTERLASMFVTTRPAAPRSTSGSTTDASALSLDGGVAASGGSVYQVLS